VCVTVSACVTKHISIDTNLISFVVFVMKVSLLRDTGLSAGTQI